MIISAFRLFGSGIPIPLSAAANYSIGHNANSTIIIGYVIWHRVETAA